MKKFKKITSTCLPIGTENIDTDQIVPARFLKITAREGFRKYLFYDWRFDGESKAKKESLFNNPQYKNAKILVAGNNFGCGSSREHAVWALSDFGFQVIISSSFGDIFYNNSFKNGLLPIALKQSELEQLFKTIKKNPNQKITVELEKQEVRIQSPILTFHFSIDPFRKTCLLQGVDELGYIFSFKKQITEFEKKHDNFISL